MTTHTLTTKVVICDFCREQVAKDGNILKRAVGIVRANVATRQEDVDLCAPDDADTHICYECAKTLGRRLLNHDFLK